jgi:PAS domain S-box-containing protein
MNSVPPHKSILNILIVDDSPEDRSVFRRYLSQDRNCDYRIEDRELGDEGLERIRSGSPPDCLLLDFNLPDMDGLEFLTELGGSDGHSQGLACAVVMLTGGGNESVAVDAMKRGAQDYLIKGRFSPEALQQTVRNALEKFELQRNLRRSEERLRLATQSAGIGTWDYDFRTGERTWDARAKTLFGLSPEAAVDYERFLSALHPEDRERVDQELKRAHSPGGGDYHIEYRTIGIEDGKLRWVSAQGRVFFDREGRAERFTGTLRDISAEKEAAQEREQTLAQIKARAERDALISQIADSLLALRDPEEVQAAAVASLGRAVGADRCYLLTIDQMRDLVIVGRDWCTHGVGPLDYQYRASSFARDGNGVFCSRRTLVVPDTQTGPWEKELGVLLRDMGILSLIHVPFFEGGRMVGALGLAMAQRPRDWTEEEVALAEVIAGQARTAIAAARVQQRERNIASSLQDALQPQAVKNIPGLAIETHYKAALDEARVGGDFYDVFAVEKGCTVLVVGDLSGKGLAAAAQVATVRNMLRYALWSNRTLSGALNELNHILSENHLLTGFATLFVGLYDQNEQTLTYICCGQEPALLWQSALREILELEVTGSIIGGFEASDFRQCVVSLSPGDVLAIFTDGLTEAGPNRRDLLGVEGVTEFFRQAVEETEKSPDPDKRAQQVIKQLVQAVDSFAKGGARDDICVLVGVFNR